MAGAQPHVEPWSPPPVPVQEAVIVAVAARKGGVGKSTLSYELAAAWGAVLVDFDWDDGCVTVSFWGTQPSDGILSALDGGPPPRLRHAGGRPDLVPCHPDLSVAGWRPEAVADALERWAVEWGRPVIVDSHPGTGELAFGAMTAAHVVLAPVELAERELDALAGMIRDHRGSPIIIAPNKVPPVPPARQLRRLERLATENQLPVTPVVSAYPWLKRRARRSALVLSPAAKATEAAVAELVAMATAVRDALPGRAPS